MNGKSMKAVGVVRTGQRRFVIGLFAIGMGLCVSSGVNAQGPIQPVKVSDLVISSLSAKLIAPNKVQYSWTITNVGSAPAKLEGPTPGNSDNVKVQAFLSKDTVFGNAGDVPAGGTIIGNSPLANLDPKTSKSGTFTATFQGSITQFPHLVLKVDVGNVVTELNENNNTAAVGIAR